MRGPFRSIRFNVVLFTIIAILSALGTFIPQMTDNAEKVSAFMANQPQIGRLFQAWGFFDIYHTTLFASLLGLMAFDVVACKLWNKPPDHGLVPLPQEQQTEDVSLRALKKKPFRLEGFVRGTLTHTSKTFSQRLQRQHYTIKTSNLPGGGVALMASRHRVQRWGSYVSHISIVVILVGAMIKSLLGFETFLPILEGQAANVTESVYALLDETPRTHASAWAERLDSIARWPKRLRGTIQRRSLDPIANWTVAIDKLTVDFYHNSTTPSTFASKLRLYEFDKPLADTTIRVNQPLDVKSVRFYQASWGVTGMIRTALLRVGDKTIPVGMKESFPIPGQPWTARIEHYLPDFVVGNDGQPSTKSLEWKNPAVVIGFYNKKQSRIGTLVVGAPSPVTPKDAEPWGMFFFAGGHLPVTPPVHVLAVQPILFSGVQVSYDPGFPVIVTGVISMLLGLCALFYMHQRKVMVFIRPGEREDEVRVDVGAWSSRGQKEYEREFQSIFKVLGLSPVGDA